MTRRSWGMIPIWGALGPFHLEYAWSPHVCICCIWKSSSNTKPSTTACCTGAHLSLEHHSMLFDSVTRLDGQHGFKQNSSACLKSDPQLLWHNLFFGEALDKSPRFLRDILLKPFWSRPTVALLQRINIIQPPSDPRPTTNHVIHSSVVREKELAQNVSVTCCRWVWLTHQHQKILKKPQRCTFYGMWLF